VESICCSSVIKTGFQEAAKCWFPDPGTDFSFNILMEIYSGCSGYHYYDWMPEFYPPDLPPEKWLAYYARYFNTLELNVTFYRFPGPSLLKKLYSESPPEFLFAVKVPRIITHYQKLTDSGELLSKFYDICSEHLREKLGPFLFQFPANIRYDEPLLERLSLQLNPFYENVIEFRHISWFNAYVETRLTEMDAIFCGVSFPGLPDKLIINTNTIYYRFHGVPILYISPVGEEKVKKFSASLLKSNATKAYIYFNNTARSAALYDALNLSEFTARFND
jgi:uncharacterized protein YecE (DUF72 family)